MPCEENREKISSLIDAELSPGEKKMLEKHLGVCAKCRTLEEWLRCVKEGIVESAASLTIPTSLREKILASLPEMPKTQKPAPWWKRFFVFLFLTCL
ncbi:MAG: zf-HC2 domain-containing protein [Deltaproteobacteria bacterium]|nr:zf-HC2 domain-containing protein [Deltaproteobacteria bacterium]